MTGRVLVVNDADSTRRLLKMNLEMQGYSVGLAANGQAGLEALEREPWDLVLLDLSMPEMDGMQLLEILRGHAELRQVPVIVVSASEERDSVRRCLELGASDYLALPVEPSLLRARVASALAGRRLQAAELEHARGLTELNRALSDLAQGKSPRLSEGLLQRDDGLGELGRSLLGVNREQLGLSLPPQEISLLTAGRILVVEDEAASRQMLVLLLRQMGYHLDTAVDGLDAWEKVQKEAFDVILLDLMMPRMNGFEFLEQIRHHPQLKELPVIVISANEDVQEVVRLIEMGARDHLVKPFNPLLLGARLRACLAGKRLRDQELAYLRGVSTLTSAAADLESDCFDSDSLAGLAERDDALGRLARVFREMAGQLVARQRGLRLQVESLREELEAARGRARLAESTHTDYFQGLEAGAQGRVVVFSSFRGGTGKSTLVANLGVLLALSGLRVGMLDVSLQAPGLHACFGLSAGECNSPFQGYLFQEHQAEDLGLDLGARLGVCDSGRLLLFSSSTQLDTLGQLLRQGYDAQRWSDGLSALLRRVDVLLLDTQAGLNDEVLLSYLLAQRVVLVLRPWSRDFEGAGVLMQILHKLKVAEVEVVANQMLPHQREGLEEQLQQAFGLEPAAVLDWQEGMGEGELFCLRQPDHPLTRSLRELALRLVH